MLSFFVQKRRMVDLFYDDSYSSSLGASSSSLKGFFQSQLRAPSQPSIAISLMAQDVNILNNNPD